MNLRKHLTMSLALAALALGLIAVPARAEPVLKGSFELPAAAYWGDTLLPAGQYNILMSVELRDIAYVPVIYVTGEGMRKTFLAVARPARESGRNCLEIADIDGTLVVRAFDAGILGKSFAFSMTRNVKNKALRASAPTLAVPVSSGAGF